MNSIAIAPFLGEEAMSDHFSAVFKKQTELRVVDPQEVARYWQPSETPAGDALSPEQQDFPFTRQLAETLKADCILYGKIVAGEGRKVRLGAKDRYNKRLYLHLVSARGRLLWKAELPFEHTQGSKPPQEEWVMEDLSDHFTAYAHEQKLTALRLTQSGKMKQ